LQSAWANPDTRTEVLRELTERGISFEELAASSDQPDADPFDLLCHLAWNAPLLTRRQRAEQARKRSTRSVRQYGDTAREILALLLDKYIERGIIQFNALSDLMKVQPFDRFGSPSEIATPPLRRRARHEGRCVTAADSHLPITRTDMAKTAKPSRPKRNRARHAKPRRRSPPARTCPR
jgi:type I site-specific restriction endonuclease